MKADKVPGIDEITLHHINHLLKLSTFNTMLNACLKLQYFPAYWKAAKVIAQPKPNKASCSDPSSF